MDIESGHFRDTHRYAHTIITQAKCNQQKWLMVRIEHYTWKQQLSVHTRSASHLEMSLMVTSGMYFCSCLSCARMKRLLYSSEHPNLQCTARSLLRPLHTPTTPPHMDMYREPHGHAQESTWTCTGSHMDMYRESHGHVKGATCYHMTLLEGEHLLQVSPADGGVAVAFPCTGQDSVGAQPHTSIHARSEVHAQERIPWIRHLHHTTPQHTTHVQT